MNLEVRGRIDREYFQEILDLVPQVGLTALGVTDAEPFHETRLEIERRKKEGLHGGCLLYTSDAADDLLCVDLGGRRII